MMVTHRAAADEFRDYCFELLSSLRQGEIVAKKMFGGTGFSIDGKTFATMNRSKHLRKRGAPSSPMPGTMESNEI
jgi:TfoX/Sxy family transcriptional regulator of competence genes